MEKTFMHVALTGASGFIGSRIAQQLHQQGHSVAALVRETSATEHIQPYVQRFVTGTQDDAAACDALLEGSDCVIHNSVDWQPLKEGDHEQHYQSNLLGTLRLMHKALPRQFVFISTIAVHHDMRPRWNGIIDEDHPTRPGMLYGAYKAAIEAHLWAMHVSHGMNFAALRPCGVYGIDPKLERSHGFDLINKIKRNEPISKTGGGKFVHVDDVAAATVACVGNPGANAGLYNLVDCYARWADWAMMACDIMGVQREIDTSSPTQPKNTFTRDAAQSLGVQLDRGHDGIRAHLEELLAVMQ